MIWIIHTLGLLLSWPILIFTAVGHFIWTTIKFICISFYYMMKIPYLTVMLPLTTIYKLARKKKDTE